MQRPVMAGRHADHFAKQPREVIHIVIAQLLSDLANALLAFVEQAAGVGHFQLDKVLNRRMAIQDAAGFGELKRDSLNCAVREVSSTCNGCSA